ncbi:MAG: hypothetical protein EBY23_02750 [Actinobacteria bacterium]|nr:hypothetical protein [Actinomycetota bacterium]
MNLMQNKKAWFSDAIFVDHVLELRKSNQRGEGLNKDWDPGSMGKITEKAGLPEIADGMRQGAETVGNALLNPHLAAPVAALGATGAFKVGRQLFEGGKKVVEKVRSAIKPKELSPEEDGPLPAGYAPVNRDFKVERKRVVGGASPKKIVPVSKPDIKAASFAGMSGVRKSFFTSAVYPEEVGRQDNYSLLKSEMTQEPEYVETFVPQPLAKPKFFESTILPHEAGHADHYLRKGIVPNMLLRKSKGV